MFALVTLMGLINQVSGTPYIPGGDSPAGTDCSGLASWVANAATGRPTFGDRFHTGNEEAALLARGFKYGTAPGALVIGWNGGHTAVTLPDGTPVSSGEGGRGVKVGGGGAYQPQFNHHMYLPADLAGPFDPLAPVDPMAPVDPLYLAWIAANRITMDGHVLAPAERLSIDKALRVDFDETTAGMFEGNAADRDRLWQSARAVYAGLSQETGQYSVEVDGDRWKQAIDIAAGGIVNLDTWTSSGRRVIKPPRMSADDFTKAVRGVSPTEIAGLGGAAGYSPDEVAEAIRDGGLVNYGDGYAVRDGAHYIMRADGSGPFVWAPGKPGKAVGEFPLGEWQPNPKDLRYNPDTGKMDGAPKGRTCTVSPVGGHCRSC